MQMHSMTAIRTNSPGIVAHTGTSRIHTRMPTMAGQAPKTLELLFECPRIASRLLEKCISTGHKTDPEYRNTNPSRIHQPKPKGTEGERKSKPLGCILCPGLMGSFLWHLYPLSAVIVKIFADFLFGCNVLRNVHVFDGG